MELMSTKRAPKNMESIKNVIFSIVVVATLIGCKPEKTNEEGNQMGNSNLTPMEVVNKRMDFYNQHNFEEFMNRYAAEVKVYTYPDKLLGTGADKISSIFKSKFAEKSIQVACVSQMENGNFVITNEIVTENGRDTKYVSIYELQNGLLKKVRFVC